MKFRLGSLFQSNAHSLPRRLYFSGVRRVTGVFSKRQSVYFVTINGKRYKRVVLGDSFEALQVEQALGLAPSGEWFPTLIQRHENELLLEFVEGRPFDPSSSSDREALVEFFAALYATSSRNQSSERLFVALETDLRFLQDAGLIEAKLRSALITLAEQTRPVEIRYGLDYVDPVAKNFLISDDRIVAIDVESLRQETPLGTGIAKAGVHWLADDELPGFVEQVERSGKLTIKGQLPFVDLCFRAGWTKRKLLQGKHRSIRVELLRGLVE